MACSECRGYGVSRCPICSSDPKMTECPTCGGKGTFYYANNIETGEIVQVTEAAYNCLPDTEELAVSKGQNYYKCDEEVCEVCDGAGEVECEIDYEPDYDE